MLIRWGRRDSATIRAVGRAALWVGAAVGVLVVLAGAVWLIWKVPTALYAYVPDPKDRAGAESSTRTGLIAGLAALGSLAVTARTYRLSLQGQLTDRYTKAVEQLGDDKLDIRLGGIYALERLAVDSQRDTPPWWRCSAPTSARTRARATPRTRPPGRRTAHPPRLTAVPASLPVDIQIGAHRPGPAARATGPTGTECSTHHPGR